MAERAECQLQELVTAPEAQPEGGYAGPSAEGPPFAEFVLRTFAVGLLPRPRGTDDELSGSAGLEMSRAGDNDAEKLSSDVCGGNVVSWHRAVEPVEITGTAGFTTLTCGSHCCVGITPEADVQRWDATTASVLIRPCAAGKRSTSTAPPDCLPSFCVEWSLSVLQNSAGQRLQLRDIAIGRDGGSNPAMSGCGFGSSCEVANRPAAESEDCQMSAQTSREETSVGAVALMEGGAVFVAGAFDGTGATSWRPEPSLQSHVVSSVSCGAGFCTILTAGGKLLAWGESKSGALGIVSDDGPVYSTTTPGVVSGALAGLRVAVFACGDQHVVAASADEAERAGALFSWGSSADLRLGYEVEASFIQPEPRMIDWLTPAVWNMLGERRGDGAEDSAAYGDSADGCPQHRTRRSSRSPPQRITQVACGSRHSVVLCQGGVICFGSDDCGQLGFGSATRSRFGNDMPPHAFAPLMRSCSPHSNNQGISTRRVCCGPLHTAAVNSDGSLYVWGLDLTQEPEGHRLDKASPGPVPVLGFGPSRPVVTLACGAHFVVASAEVELRAPSDTATWASSHFDSQQGAAPLPVGQNSWRPANLPPKEEDEALKHRALVRDLEVNVQRRMEAEQREALIRRERENRRERRLLEHTEIWLTQLLPDYAPGARPSRRIERLWRQGLPPKVREVLWPIAIGNVLRITPELFEIHKQQAVDARRAEQATDANVLITLHGKERSTECIPFDLPRTFPTLAFFREGGPLHEDCARILEAYTFFRPDIGYVQGMSFLAAVLLLYMPVYPAFVGLCNLINSPSILGLYRLEPRAVECRADLFRRLCGVQMPAVARCIEDAGLTAEMFLIEWFMTLYAKCLPLDVASVVWDLFLLDGEVVLYCTALALLRISEQPLLANGGADLQVCSKILGEDLRHRVTDPDELLWHIQVVWRRAPSQLLAEIRGIEHAEFSSTSGGGHTKSRADSAVGGHRSWFSGLRSRLMQRWHAPAR